MPPTCQLVQFSDRLFFTTFPAPLPPQDSLNAPGAAPSTRLVPPSPTRGIAPVSPEDDGEDQPPSYFFTLDDQLVYLSFFEDWGPFNLACVYKACILMHELIGDDTLKGHRLVLYSSDDPRRKANAALLLALFLMIVQRRTPWDAFHPIAGLEFMPFRDAGRGRSDFNLSITDCLWGVWKAIQNGLCDMNDFSVDEYEFYEKVENGDWNWITPNFIAFASPVEPAFARREKERVRAAAAAGGGAASVPPTPSGPSTSTTPGGSSAMRGRLPIPFQNCLDYFQRHNVKLVVRLNNALYDSALFEERGIEHLEMYFDDGSNPTDEIVRKFIAMSDAVIEAGGVVAVHCKAGLGRTGTLIGAYLIWKYGFTANEAIAFMRIVRPGSVVGPQQQYMYMKQLEWCKWAAVDEMRRVQAAATTAAAVPVSPATPPAEEGEEDIRMREVALVPAIVAAKQKIPPVTPSRHVAASTKLAAGPPQPRKTPQTAKRTAEDAALPEHGDDDDDDESDIDPAEEPEERTLRARATASVSPAPKPSAPVAAGKSKALAAATAVGKPKSVTAAARAATNAAKERAAKEKEHAAKEKENAAAVVPAAASGSGAGTGSSSGGVRVTRSKAAAATGTTLPTSGSNASIKPAAAAAAAAAAPTTATAASAGASAIPKSATAASAATRTPRPVGATRRKVPGSPPGVPPSRLPTLVPSKRSYALAQEAEIDREKRTRSAAKKAAAAGEKEKDGEPAWVKNADREKVLERTPTPGATPGTGSTRPSLRNVRRRRSSFGSVDVVV